jgi:hypothetical protein
MILDNHNNQVNNYDNSANGGRYNYAYECAINNINLPEKANDLSDIVEPVLSFLRAFDMSRTMGQNSSDIDNPNSFAYRLNAKLNGIHESLLRIRNVHPANFSMRNDEYKNLVTYCYTILAERSQNGLDSRNYTDPKGRLFAYDVGTTKILHILLPNHFIILDRYMAFALRDNYPEPRWGYRKNFPTGHSVEKYVRGLQIAYNEVNATFDVNNWEDVRKTNSNYRIFDKCGFIVGSNKNDI